MRIVLFLVTISLVITTPTVLAGDFDDRPGTNQTHVSSRRTIVVDDAFSLKKAVQGNYTKIIVHGTIQDAWPLALKDNVTLEGENSASKIMTVANSDAISLGKNNIIRNITITLSESYDANDPNSYEKNAIVNHQGASLGNFVAENIITNSGIVLHVTDIPCDLSQ
jgi:hypothetical protein